jgi:ribonucleoside-diphosphate reductase alpha chain
MSAQPQQPAAHQLQPGTRHRLEPERRAVTHRFKIGDEKFYLIVGMYENGQPGEMFIRAAKTGSTMAGLLDGISIAVSISLQYGVPLSVLVEKFAHTRFEPDGFTGNPEIPIAKSILDYIFRWMAERFPAGRPQ